MTLPSQCAVCPQSAHSKGFALHSGALPPKSGICVLLESPGPDEPSFMVKDLADGAAELARRRARYPELEERHIRLGAPVVGRAGTLMWNWLMRPLNLERIDVAIFNTLHCFVGKGAKGEFAYPTGNVRKKAEATCADLWLRPLVEWEPTISIVCMHPAALSRDITPLPVALRAIERAKIFASKGERVLLLMGGKAAKHWIGYGENTTRWCCHWQRETEWTRRARAQRWEDGMKLSTEKKVRVKKLTVKAALAQLLETAKVDSDGNYTIAKVLTKEQYDAMVALCAAKPKRNSPPSGGENNPPTAG